MSYEPKDSMLNDLRTMTGAAENEAAALTLALKITGTKVLNEIRQKNMPVMLESIVVEMAADAFRLNKQAQGSSETGKIAGTISSVSDHGQSVSYRDNGYQAILSAVSQTLRNYTAQLDRFRKSGW